MKRRCLALAILLLCIAVPASSEPITLTVQGAVTVLDPNSHLSGLVANGDLLTATLVYDSAAGLENMVTPDIWDYYATSMTVSVGSLSLVFSTHLVETVNGPTMNRPYDELGSFGQAWGVLVPNDEMSYALHLRDLDGSTLSSPALITDAAIIQGFAVRSFNIASTRNGNSDFWINVPDPVVTQPVVTPEPVSGLLLLAGVPFLALRRRR